MHDTMVQCKTPNRRPQVVEQLDELANALDDLSKVTEELETRLSKVMREELEQPCSAVSPADCLVPIATYIRELHWKSRSVEHRISEINRCLEI